MRFIKDNSFWVAAREASKNIKSWPKWKQDYLEQMKLENYYKRINTALSYGWYREAKETARRGLEKYPENKRFERILMSFSK